MPTPEQLHAWSDPKNEHSKKMMRRAMIMAADKIEKLEQAINEIRGLSGSCMIQMIPSDDQIIADNIKKIHKLSGG